MACARAYECSRYLRARKWVPQDAYGQFSETEKFRNANEIETLYDTIDIDSYEASRKLVCNIPDLA
jgi:hypothetical protein